jgi:hypothetical protein
MSLEQVVQRIAVGWGRTVSPAAMRLADEAAVEARAVVAAVDRDDAVGDIQAATVRSAWIEQITRLQGIHNRDRAQELLLAQLRRNVRTIDSAHAARNATPEALGQSHMALFGAVGGAGLLGAVSWFRPWMLWAGAIASLFAWGSVQSARLKHVKAELTETLRVAETLEQERDGWREQTELYQAAVGDAREAAHRDAAALEAERRRQARAAQVERRRQREIHNVIVGSGDPPDWRLRDDTPVSE